MPASPAGTKTEIGVVGVADFHFIQKATEWEQSPFFIYDSGIMRTMADHGGQPPSAILALQMYTQVLLPKIISEAQI
jgi:hypothetical protein